MSNKTKFALTPGLTSDQPIDYSTTWGLKQWTESTKKLSDNLFDGIPQNLKMFLERLASRVVTAGWKSITKVDGKDLLTQYGTISISSGLSVTGQGWRSSDQQTISNVYSNAQLHPSIYYLQMRSKSCNKWRDLWSRSEEWRWKGDGTRWTIISEDPDLKSYYRFKIYCFLHPKNTIRAGWLHDKHRL